MDVVNEKTTAVVTCTFTDEDGSAVTPSTTTYRIDDVDTDTQILDDTVIVPSSSAEDYVITAAQNAMVTATKPREVHRLTITFTYTGAGAGQTGRGEYEFVVKNMTKIT